jgi:hypothetical protein
MYCHWNGFSAASCAARMSSCAAAGGASSAYGPTPSTSMRSAGFSIVGHGAVR